MKQFTSLGRTGIGVAALWAATFWGTATGFATVITLSGGDPGFPVDGWTAPTSPLFAYNLGEVTDRTIQSVLFKSWTNVGAPGPANAAGATVTTNANGTSNYAAPSYSSPTANDTAMAQMIRHIFFSTAAGGAGPLKFTMTGLAPLASYRVDAFTLSGDLTRQNTYTFNGAVTDTWTQNVGTSYLVQNTVNADATGKIVLDVAIPSPVAPPASPPHSYNPVLSGLVVSSTITAASFTEDFSDNSPGPHMALGTGGGSPAPTTDFTGDFTVTSGVNSRIYLGTVATDYANTNFVFEATVTVPNTGNPWSTAFFGMGNFNAAGGVHEPGNPNILATIRPDLNGFGTRDNSVVNDPSNNMGGTPAAGTHRLRMTWNAATKQAVFDLDYDYTGVFTPTAVPWIVNGADNGFTALNSRLFLGGGNLITFDDILVTIPEPSSLLLFSVGALLCGWKRRRLTK